MSAKGFWATQDGHVVNILPPASAGAAVVGTRFSMSLWAHASILIRMGVAGGPIGAVTLKVYPTETGGTGVAIPFRYALQNSATAPFDVFGPFTKVTATGYVPGGADVVDEMAAIELDAADLLVAANGAYVELNIAAGSLGTTAQLMDALAILSGGRNASDQSPSVQV
jgi:hypothetical protein